MSNFVAFGQILDKDRQNFVQSINVTNAEIVLSAILGSPPDL